MCLFSRPSLRLRSHSFFFFFFGEGGFVTPLIWTSLEVFPRGRFVIITVVPRPCERLERHALFFFDEPLSLCPVPRQVLERILWPVAASGGPKKRNLVKKWLKNLLRSSLVAFTVLVALVRDAQGPHNVL